MTERMRPENIVLIGMPASGKSTAGVILAKILGMDFMDTDLLIQKREGARLERIIEEQGVDRFLEKEEEALLSVDVNGTVIATGGSAVYSRAGMEHLSQGAVIVYLQVGEDEIMRRLGDMKERGVVLRAGETVTDMYRTRSALYEQYAHITVREGNGTMEDTVQAILRSGIRERSERKHVRVVAAVILDRKTDEIFATARGYGEYKGWWEFPGGKIEAGETPQQALVREIREELTAEISVGELIRTIEYDYPDFHLSMDCFWAEIVSGKLVLKEAEAARWLSKEQLDDVRWLPADRELVRFMRERKIVS